jgi:hypothetical protein
VDFRWVARYSIEKQDENRTLTPLVREACTWGNNLARCATRPHFSKPCDAVHASAISQAEEDYQRLGRDMETLVDWYRSTVEEGANFLEVQ